MTTLAIVLMSIAAWLYVGHRAGVKRAPVAFANERKRYPSLARYDNTFGRGAAQSAYFLCLFGGPLPAVFFAVAAAGSQAITAAVPELAAAEAAKRRAELADLQRQINAAHAELGIAPMRVTE